MADLIKNGGFLADLSDWVSTPYVAWEQTDGHLSYGCAEFKPDAGNAATITQTFTTATSGDGSYRARLSFSIKVSTATAPTKPLILHVFGIGTIYTTTLAGADHLGQQWYRYQRDMIVQDTTSITLRFQVALGACADHWRIDDAVFDLAVPVGESCADLTLELRKLRGDLAAQKHPLGRYQEIVNRAIRDAPRSLWRTDIDTTISTVVDQLRYSLATITALSRAKDLREVGLYDSDDLRYYRVTHWGIEDDNSVYTLILVEPPSDVRAIQLSFLIPHAELDCADSADVTTLDRDWLIAKAMTYLLVEADPTIEDPNALAAQLQMWDSLRQAREREARYTRPAKRALTQKWS